VIHIHGVEEDTCECMTLVVHLSNKDEPTVRGGVGEHDASS